MRSPAGSLALGFLLFEWSSYSPGTSSTASTVSTAASLSCSSRARAGPTRSQRALGLCDPSGRTVPVPLARRPRAECAPRGGGAGAAVGWSAGVVKNEAAGLAGCAARVGGVARMSDARPVDIRGSDRGSCATAVKACAELRGGVTVRRAIREAGRPPRCVNEQLKGVGVACGVRRSWAVGAERSRCCPGGRLVSEPNRANGTRHKSGWPTQNANVGKLRWCVTCFDSGCLCSGDTVPK